MTGGKRRLASLLLCAAFVASAQAPPRHGTRPARLLIRNAMVVEGVGTPAFGPTDILIEGNRIGSIGRVNLVPRDAAIIELQQEAGFHPLAVLKHATHNGARVLGKESEIGRLRPGWLADLIVVNGNPLENFKRLYPSSGHIEWTIKDGIPYHAPTKLVAEVKEIVAKAMGTAGP